MRSAVMASSAFSRPKKRPNICISSKTAMRLAARSSRCYATLRFAPGAKVTGQGVRVPNASEYAFLFLEEPSVCISLYDDAYCAALDRAERPYKIINLGRFFDTKRFAPSRAKYRFAEKCRDALMERGHRGACRSRRAARVLGKNLRQGHRLPRGFGNVRQGHPRTA